MNRLDMPDDRTVVLPAPGARREPALRDAPAAPPGNAVSEPATTPVGPDKPVPPGPAMSENPLLAAAGALLSAAPRLRATPHHDDPDGLRTALVASIKEFQQRAEQAGVRQEHVLAARYAICTLLDEAVADTPWGGNGTWVRKSLLVLFHNETWGGEKCFQILAKIVLEPETHHDLLELFQVCLALGLEGRYRVQQGGRDKLASIRERVGQALSRGRETTNVELSDHWRPAAAAGSRARRLPIAIVAGVAVLALGTLYAVLLFVLNVRSDPVFAALASIKPQAVVSPRPATRVEAPRTAFGLAALLKPEIDAGRVAVDDRADRSVVTLKGDTMFEPGGAELSEPARDVLVRVAEALAKVPGAIAIGGHSDDRSIRTVRYPSNQELSRARALAVQSVLAVRVPAVRMVAQGYADRYPVADNATPAGRARNRRVEITLTPAEERSK